MNAESILTNTNVNKLTKFGKLLVQLKIEHFVLLSSWRGLLEVMGLCVAAMN